MQIQTSVLPEEAAELGRLAKDRDVLEIGSAYGFSACVMAIAGARSVTAADPHEMIAGSYAAMTQNLEDCGVAGKVTIWRHASPALPDGRFGMVFVDGDHRADAVAADIRLALRRLEPGGILAVHDYGEDCCCPDVRAVVSTLGLEGTVTGTLFVTEA